MISIEDAFKKFKSRLELTEPEQKSASRRQIEVREVMGEAFFVDHDFLSGSYARWTKTKPLKDVDIFCVLDEEKEGAYLKLPSKNLLDAVEKALQPHYGATNVSQGRRSVQVRFGLTEPGEDQPDQDVMSVDVVPAFNCSDAYKIPDPKIPSGWTRTDPTIHKDKTTEANKGFAGEWKPLVKMLKKWNETQGKPIKPSFLIEVMALDILRPPFSGGYVYELKSFFATAAECIHETWPDPAGLGPPVSDQMDASRIATAKAALLMAEKNVAAAILLAKQGKNGEALRVWRDKIFGNRFPLS